MRRSHFILLALLLSAFFTACRMEDYYPSKVSEYFPKADGPSAEGPGVPVGSADSLAPVPVSPKAPTDTSDRTSGDTASDSSATRDTVSVDTAAADTVNPALPADTVRLVLPTDTVKPVLPTDTVKPVLPADTVKPVLPADTVRPALPADTVKPALPVDTTKPAPPADTVKPATPADTAGPKPPSDSTKMPADTAKAPVRPDTLLLPKPGLPSDTVRPALPVDTAKPNLPLPAAVPALLRANLDDQLSSCWGARGGSGYSHASCGVWSQIGSFGSKLAEGLGRGGSKALSVTFSRNEEVAGASLPVSADTVNVRAWYNFAPGFDFGQGVKIGRISSFNEATQMNDIDIIMTVRSAGGSGQCGTTGMADLGLFFNGRPVGYDWGAITAPRSFQPGTWHSLEYQVALNTPGRSNGSVKLWVDGVLAAQRTGLNIRGGGGSSVKLNRLRIGGWYSNSAGGNGCADPAQPSTMLIDDVAVGKGYIGLD